MTRKRKRPRRRANAALVQRRLVPNPYFAPEHPEARDNPREIEVDLNTRESAIETLYARRFLGLAQKKAADRFRELWEAAGGRTGSLDYTRDRVDGARGDPVTARLAAAQEMRRVRYLLGQRGFDLVQAVCGEGKALPELAARKRDRLTTADNLRADLDDLAGMWGLMTRRRRP